MKTEKCCNEEPLILEECKETCDECCHSCPAKIECQVCGRIVYGSDEEEVERWNSGEDDE